jgi:drug/metabolite transporter (DMT)-like permease
MWMLCALGTAVCFGANNTLFKWGTMKNLSTVMIQFFFNVFAFLIVLLYGIIAGDVHLNPLAMLVGAVIGVMNANGNLQMTKAFEKGPASVTSTLIAMNSIVVVVATAFFFPESIPLLHWFGVALMLGAAILVQYQRDASGSIDTRAWLLRCVLAVLSIGTVGVLMKVAARLQFDFYNILLSLYGGGGVFLGIHARKELHQIAQRKTEIRLGLVVSVLSTTAYSCYLLALKTGPASLVFPIISLNCLVVMLAGLLIFKEKLRNLQVAGMILALIGLVLTKV